MKNALIRRHNIMSEESLTAVRAPGLSSDLALLVPLGSVDKTGLPPKKCSILKYGFWAFEALGKGGPGPVLVSGGDWIFRLSN